MTDYKYESRTADGKGKSGVISAASLEAASKTLRDRGEHIVQLQSASGSDEKKPIWKTDLSFGPSASDIQNFTNQLAVMLRAGIALRSAVEGIADQTVNPKFRTMLNRIKSDLEGGKQFSDALLRYPKSFGPLYINMVKASEMSGGLSKMLDRISNYLIQQIETKRMVTGAMVYPGIIGTLAIGTGVFMLTFVLPRFMVMFKGKEHILPLPTKMLLATSNFMTNYWYLILMGLVALVWGLVMALRTEVGRNIFDSLKLKVPLFKKLFRALYISRSLHTMGQLINAGVPMLDTIAITADISGNVHYRKLWHSVHTAIKQGKKISVPLQNNSMLPKSVIQMVSAGEESGKLGEVLDEVSEFYKRELVATIKTVTGMIEPLMIVVMGGMVGFIAMAIILPIFKMSQIMK
jgi:type IV pilus assembly protein PilC